MSFRLDKATRSSLDPTSWGRRCFTAASYGLDNTKSTGSMSSTTREMQGFAPHAHGSFMNIACACRTQKPPTANKFAITTEIKSQALCNELFTN